MAQTGLRIRIGDDVRYLEATDDKPAIAYARLAESRWERDTDGNFTELEPEWHNGVFRDRQADLIREYEKGDSLLVIGNVSEYEKTGNDGRVYTNVDLNVNHFAPDLADRAVTINYDRSKRQSREQRKSASQDQEADIATAPAGKEATHGLTMDTVNTIDAEIESRLQQLVAAGRVKQRTASKMMLTLSGTPGAGSSPELYCAVSEDVARQHLPPAEAFWVGHTPRAMLTGQKPPTWQQAQVAVASQQPPEQQAQQQQQQSMQMTH